MNGHTFDLHGARLLALASGALWWPETRLLCVSDLHLGKSERLARRGGGLLPPYETRDTLARLDADLAATDARHVVCLGDSFDDLDAATGLDEADRLWLLRLMAGRNWTWIEGNHDPGPMTLGGAHRHEMRIGPLVFRHIAAPDARAEVSGHFHPKLRLGGTSRACFLLSPDRAILPAFGTYTGGLSCTDPVLTALAGSGAWAVMTGRTMAAVPLDQISPRASASAR